MRINELKPGKQLSYKKNVILCSESCKYALTH